MVVFVLELDAHLLLLHEGVEPLFEELALCQVQFPISYSLLIQIFIDIRLAEVRLRMLGVGMLRINAKEFMTASKL